MYFDHLQPTTGTQHCLEIFHKRCPTICIDAIYQQSAVDQMKLLRPQAASSLLSEWSVHVESRFDVLLYSLLFTLAIFWTVVVTIAIIALAGENVDANNLGWSVSTTWPPEVHQCVPWERRTSMSS